MSNVVGLVRVGCEREVVRSKLLRRDSMEKIVRIGLLLLVLLWMSSFAFAKPAPPPGLMDILGEFSEIEEKFEDGEWESARESLAEISEKYNEVYAQHDGVISGNLNKNFNSCCDKFKMNLVVKDEEQTEKSFVNLRLVLFDIMDQFDYEVHPVIALMQKFIGDEAKEALEEGNYREVRSEIEEVYAFFRDSTMMLKKNGVEDKAVESFMETMSEAMRFAKDENKQMLETTLDKLEKQLIAFQETIQKV